MDLVTGLAQRLPKGASMADKSGVFGRNLLRDTGLIVLGSVVFAVGLDCFEVPNGLAAGGFSGLAMIIAELLRPHGITLTVGMQVLVMNLLLFWPVIHEGGMRYAARTLIGMVVSSLATDLLAPVLPVLGNGDLMLCALWGGVVCGLGLGIVFRAGGNTGGSDIVAQILSHHTPLSMGTASLSIDTVVVAISSLVFGIERALYAAIALYLSSRVLDLVIDGFNTHRAAYVISDRHVEVKRRIFSDLDRGCTELLARGGYTGVDRPVIFVVLTRSEMAMLRRIVAEVDPGAAIVVARIHEAFGNGFQPIAKQLG